MEPYQYRLYKTPLESREQILESLFFSILPVRGHLPCETSILYN